MRKIYFVLSIIFLAACSKQTDVPYINTNIVESFSITYFNITGIPLTTENFSLENNKIANVTILNHSNNEISNTTYNYSSDKLTKIVSTKNNVETSVTELVYNDNQLSEISFIKNDNLDGTNILKVNYTNDLNSMLFSSKNNSNDEISNGTITLDTNNNRIYFEENDLINNQTKVIQTEYDTTNNPKKEIFFSKDNNTLHLNFSNTITHNSERNTLYNIYENTYSKRTLMLIYHLQSKAINNINTKNISPNIVSEFHSSFADNFQFKIDNTITNDGYLEKGIYKYYDNNSNLISHFEIEFSFKN
ncbi:hypothetical protein [uncultured Tenacibaculum sp.]|uniref:hypothetical protein n=1 Tax=uncultured Tenacibaculum sp. TaxID=174713 RepID=UPI002616B1FD|nr:hypothetical protein [uncultured Tenacibaculum sp.]